MGTKAIANKVAAKYGTRDPFCIADDLGFIVIHTPLIEMRGLEGYRYRRFMKETRITGITA